MQRYFLIFVIGTIISFGCAARIPVAPETGMPSPQNQRLSSIDDPHRLWMEAKLFINDAHDRVDVVPQREARFHLNALKFLESYCTDCLKITQIKNNGDGTIDLTVKITHPFKGYRQYTGFDVKGIIMFNGSHEFAIGANSIYFDLPEPTRISWRELGDPQVLDADGYVRRWSPSYQSGSDLPMFNYWKGNNATGEPTADVNAFLNFYTKEDRHIFEVNKSVSRTYKIWLPAGQPVIAGYAVEACWEPPTVTPVTYPLTDFPTSANQPEAYYVNWVVNNGDPIKYMGGCCQGVGDCSDVRLDIKQWGGIITNGFSMHWQGSDDEPWKGPIMSSLQPCNPPQDGVLSPWNFPLGTAIEFTPGKYQFLFALYKVAPDPAHLVDVSFTVLEFQTIE